MGETYYVRAYATNSVGTAYSANEINFMTISSQPKVSVDGVSGINVTKGSATFKGTIVDAGDPAYFERGFVYGTIHNPTLNDTKIRVNGTGIGEFSADITGLQLDKNYYLRTYATSKIGETEQTVYSENEIQFTLSSTAPIVSTQAVTNLNVSVGSVTFNGTVESVGNPAYTERGFVYGLTSNPTVDDTKIVVNGTGAGAFSIGVSGLLPDQKYYVRAYAINATQTAYSADNVTFTLTSTAPEVSIQAAEDVDVETGEASLYGSIVSVGDPAYTECGFVYALWNNPTLDDSEKAIVTKSGTGVFRTRITGLSLEKTYYVRAYATNLAGTAYSSQITVSTKATLPQVETLEAADVDISIGTATLRGNIVNAGSPVYSECGFVYSAVASEPTINDNKIVGNGSGTTGSFSVYTTELPANKTVYVRAYVTNRGGTAYGQSITLKPQWIDLPSAGISVQTEDIGNGYWDSVNSMCENSIVGGKTDWRLPTKEELMVLYNERDYIGGFTTTSPNVSPYYSYYWSSTTYGYDYHYYINFFNGDISHTTGNNDLKSSNSGRCVRTLDSTVTNR